MTSSPFSRSARVRPSRTASSWVSWVERVSPPTSSPHRLAWGTTCTSAIVDSSLGLADTATPAKQAQSPAQTLKRSGPRADSLPMRLRTMVIGVLVLLSAALGACGGGDKGANEKRFDGDSA